MNRAEFANSAGQKLYLEFSARRKCAMLHHFFRKRDLPALACGEDESFAHVQSIGGDEFLNEAIHFLPSPSI
jgi:hypothetical protein